MKIGLRCEKCGNIHMQTEDECTVLIDFKDKSLSFVCPTCKHDNMFDFGGWESNSKKSSLPKIGISRY